MSSGHHDGNSMHVSYLTTPGKSVTPGKYQKFSDELSDSDFSSCDLEAGDSAKV